MYIECKAQQAAAAESDSEHDTQPVSDVPCEAQVIYAGITQTATDTLSLSSHVNAVELLITLMTMPVNHHVRRTNLMLQLLTSGLLGTCIMSTTMNGSLGPILTDSQCRVTRVPSELD